jgi:hypothetical protein
MQLLTVFLKSKVRIVRSTRLNIRQQRGPVTIAILSKGAGFLMLPPHFLIKSLQNLSSIFVTNYMHTFSSFLETLDLIESDMTLLRKFDIICSIRSLY